MFVAVVLVVVLAALPAAAKAFDKAAALVPV
jgi:hypothetical protein